MSELPQIMIRIIQGLYKNQKNSTKALLNDSNVKQQGILIKKKIKRIFTYSHNQTIIKNPSIRHHVYRLFDTYNLNLRALDHAQHDENLLKTYFYHRIITKVQKYSNSVVISSIPQFQELLQPNLDVFLQDLRSLVNKNKIFEIISQLIISLDKFKKGNHYHEKGDDSKQITKILNTFGNSMFFCKFGFYKIAISNSLLEFLGFDIDEFSIEAIKYRTIFFDFLSSSSYPIIVSHCLSTLKSYISLKEGLISSQTHQKNLQLYFKDYIYTKKNSKSYCSLYLHLPKPGMLYIKVLETGKQICQLDWKQKKSKPKQIQQGLNKVKRDEHGLLYKLSAVNTKNIALSVAGYKNINENVER